MKTKDLYFTWGFFYILCAILGFIQEPADFLKALLFLLGVGFFVPPFLLLHRAAKARDLKLIRRLLIISACALALAFVLIVVNILSLGLSTAAGDVLYWILTVFASPMVCGQVWVVTLFLWAVLLFSALTLLKKK